MTDITADATWRAEAHRTPVWDEKPSVAELRSFSADVVSLDILHIYHLGCGRDVAASVLCILLKKGLVQGRNALYSDMCSFVEMLLN